MCTCVSMQVQETYYRIYASFFKESDLLIFSINSRIKKTCNDLTCCLKASNKLLKRLFQLIFRGRHSQSVLPISSIFGRLVRALFTFLLILVVYVFTETDIFYWYLKLLNKNFYKLFIVSLFSLYL